MAQGPRGEQRVSPLQWIPKSLLSQPSQPSPHSFSLPSRPRAQRSSERGPGIPPVLQALEPVIHWPRVTQHTRGSTGIRTQACVTAKPSHPHQGAEIMKLQISCNNLVAPGVKTLQSTSALCLGAILIVKSPTKRHKNKIWH